MGYGDVTPERASGRFIATVMMLAGIGLLAVITASVTASLVESSRRRFTAQSEADDTRQFGEITDRLARIEAALSSKRMGGHRMDPAEEPGSITGEMGDAPSGSALPAPGQVPAPRSRIRRVFGRSRELWRVVYRDPEHVPERLTLYTAGRLGESSRQWASQCGAIAPTPTWRGSPRGCVRNRHTSRGSMVRSQELPLHRARARLPHVSAAGDAHDAAHRRTDGRDPQELRTSAEMLALRGVHPDVRGRGGCADLGARQGTADRPEHRRSWRTWVHSVYLLLIFGGFMSPLGRRGRHRSRGKVMAVFGVLLGWGSR